MDLETENRLAAMLMKEAAELRRQAEKDGVHAYLRQPNSRGRPNSRFLTATVLGVEQANRAVEVGEMWRVRQKEIELNDRLRDKVGDGSSTSRRSRGSSEPQRSIDTRDSAAETSAGAGCSSSKRPRSRDGEGLKDDDIDEFLHSRVKRGRGAVGSRMDETGPYLPSREDYSPGYRLAGPESGDSERWVRHVLGPKKPSLLRSSEYYEEEEEEERELLYDKRKTADKVGSKKLISTKNKSKEKSRDKKKKKKRKEERKSKHRK